MDVHGNVYISGHTNYNNFPTTPGCFDPTYNGGAHTWGGELIVASFDPSLSDLISATYLGGSGQETDGSLVIDEEGNVYVCGATNSSDFPIIPGGLQDEYGGGYGDEWAGDFFISVIPRIYYIDLDGDGVVDLGDNCPDNPNPEQEDFDEDGIGNICDGCPGDYNPLQEDNDADGIQDACDNCPEHYNPGQEDSNGNDIGDLCDYICGDTDGDRLINILDIVYLINYKYKSGPAPDPLESADVNE